MKTLDYNAIQKDITNNYLDLKSGILDVYTFMHELTLKHIAPIFPECRELEGENPFADMLFVMFEINRIELY